ncbi:hypothetical protein [Ruegeria sp. Alg231-54]|uniref:hypothetical protein n=1 Tax=Ruegeria sp. Alg231-54 TaxID=1922221 RepID=UPI000D54DF67|nr:hypothetical protein [Ruegeria sp. Alg231-54]
MIECEQAPVKPTEQLIQAWVYQSSWSLKDAVLLALGISPDDAGAAKELDDHSALLTRTKRSGERFGAPVFWLWWAERNNLPFHADWWLAITPERPIVFDGQHFAHRRKEILSPEYAGQERILIGEWVRKPYWTAREAIDLSLNFKPFRTESWRGNAPETGETIRERDDRFLILERALEIGEISEKAPAKDYLLWLAKRGYYVSLAWRRAVGMPPHDGQHPDTVVENAEIIAENEKLRDMLRAKDERLSALDAKLEASSSPENSRAQKSASTTRIATLQKALIACAVDGHSYTPIQKRSDVPKQIADKAAELGCGVDQQTVRRLLKEASELHVNSNYWSD